MRIRLLVGVTFRPDAHFRAAISAEHGTILNQSDFQAVAGRQEGSAGSRQASAHHDEVEFAAIVGVIRQFQQGTAKLR